MEATKQSFVFYSDWWKVISAQSVEIQREILPAIIEYGCTGKNTGRLGRTASLIFELVKGQIDRYNEI